MDKEIIKFIRQKDYNLIGNIGLGSTGDVRLLKDEMIGEIFACKKYAPTSFVDGNEYYNYFKNEIKILYQLNHKNIVRVFSYYMYPEQNTGYIIMEYIEGDSIDKYVAENPNILDSLFEQVIDGFIHMHNAGILHRDIKPSNILITKDGVVKIIDFGFGKQTDVNKEQEENSLSLAGMYDRPNDYKEYSFSTEVYFVGQLFRGLVTDHHIKTFRFESVLEQMCSKNPENRAGSFLDIYRLMTEIEATDFDFEWEEKKTYRSFADNLSDILAKIYIDAKYETNIDEIINDLETLYNNSMLEENVQDPSKVIAPFINGGYGYLKKNTFPVYVLEEFIKLLKTSSDEKKRIILNNLWGRFDTKERIQNPKYEELPF